MTTRRRRGPARVPRTAIAEQHLTWLQALPGDGPFLTVPVLTEAMPTGLELTPPDRAQRFRLTYDSFRSAAAANRDTARDAFLRDTLTSVLDWADHVDTTPQTAQAWTHTSTGFGVTTTPSMVLWPCDSCDIEPDTRPSMLVFTWSPGTALNRRLLDGWSATPIDRAAAALRHFDIPVGLVTDGRWWAVVWAPRGSATGHVLFDTHAMLDDRQQLDAFTTIVSRRRFLAVAPDDTLPRLLNRALESQEDLTENLSLQVRRAVEMLVDAAGRADAASGGRALAGVSADEVYEGAVVLVMRLVFLLAAEERRLLPADDAFYAADYGIAALSERLIDHARAVGEEVLAHHSEAVPQILATTRIVHDGVRHPRLNIKGYGGSVFDPDRHPWLEGRQPDGTGQPIHVDDRTMLHILHGLTRWQGRRLAYRTLDVEQIGYVYEGLLDHTAMRATSVVLGLRGDKEPEVILDAVEDHATRDRASLAKWLKDITGLSAAQVKRALDTPLPDAVDQLRSLTSACGGDRDLAERVAPFHALLRTDDRTHEPVVYLPGAWYVTKSSARSDAGSYYTPRPLAEDVVRHTLDALVYDPGPYQTLDDDQWRIVHPERILALNVADIAMGSGAFLVAADRYLADRLLEALARHDLATLADPALIDLHRLLAARDDRDPSLSDSEADEATITARRLIATRCLYGVDINPMAVEMAKLSLWLATAAKDQPFGFLDHHLAYGDTLLGLTDVRQLENVHPDPDVGARIHANQMFDQTRHIRSALDRAVGERTAIETMQVHDIRDVEQQQALLDDADRRLADIALLADAITAQSFNAAQNNNRDLDALMLSLGSDGGELLNPNTTQARANAIRQHFRQLVVDLNNARPDGAFERTPLEFVLRFPEIFDSDAAGFDAIIGNPPYLGGKRITGALGTDYRSHLVIDLADGRRGNADLVVYFLLRSSELSGSRVGLLTTNTVGQGDSREVGTESLLQNSDWQILRAVRSDRWPSKSASLEYSAVYLDKQPLPDAPRVLDGDSVGRIGADLRQASRIDWTPHRLAANARIAFQGSIALGLGFTLSEEAAQEMIKADPRNADVLFPYLNGQDLNSSPCQSPSRWIINFFDWPEDKARTYPLPFAQIEREVKPERTRRRPDGGFSLRKPLPQRWWIYADKRPGLYTAIAKLDSVLAITLVSNVVQPVRVPSRQVFANVLGIFSSDSPAFLGLLVSQIHGEWARKIASSLETRIRYTPSDVFETFPVSVDMDKLTSAGEVMEEARETVLLGRDIGLTATYNLVNDERNRDADVVALRDAYVALDRAVLDAYGWTDVEPVHGFYDTDQGVRFCMDRETTAEVLERLLALNKERYEVELAAGLHAKGAKILAKKPSGRSGEKSGGAQDALFS